MIKVANVSKKFKIYSDGFSRLKDWLTPRSLRFHQEFWALREISFDLEEGGSLGIIGSNGAGKSTLLKILSGISKPTAGNFNVEGRIASLLDLGLGFHSELSGRENIILSARFLGLKDEEIKTRLEMMIEFAELGKFVDLPIRTYSTGMFVRLGFAVAAGVDPDVLIIDEVLSVGDAYFQRKSLNRVEYLKGLSKTIVMVSHSMPIIQRFCDKTLWLNEGRIMAFGETNRVVKEYELFSKRREEMKLGTKVEEVHLTDMSLENKEDRGHLKMLETRWGTGEIEITRVEMVGEEERPKWHFSTGERLKIRLFYHAHKPIDDPIFGLLLHGIDGTLVFATANYNIDPYNFGRIDNKGCVEYTLDQLNLNKGTYFLSVAAFLKPDHPFWSNPADFHHQMYEFRVWSEKIEHGFVHLIGNWGVNENGCRNKD